VVEVVVTEAEEVAAVVVVGPVVVVVRRKGAVAEEVCTAEWGVEGDQKQQLLLLDPQRLPSRPPNPRRGAPCWMKLPETIITTTRRLVSQHGTSLMASSS